MTTLRQAWSKRHTERLPLHAALTAVPISFISFAQPASQYCEHVYTYTWAGTAYDLRLLLNNTVSETFLQKSGAMRSVDWINIIAAPAWRWLGELRDNGQNVLQSSFQTGRSSKPRCFPIFFLTAILQEAFIRNITTLHINCIIVTCNNNNNKVINNNCRSQWPRGLRRRSTAARLLRLWVRIPPGA